MGHSSKQLTFVYDPFFSPTTYLLGLFHWSSFKEGTELWIPFHTSIFIFKKTKMIDLSEIVLVNLIKHSGIEMWPHIITYLNFIGSVFFGI